MKLVVLAMVLSSVWVAACSSGDTPTKLDAQGSGSGSGSGAGSGSGSGSGGAFGATCTVASETSTECKSHICANFGGSFLCTAKCTMPMMNDPTECPSGSMGTKCANQGYCRP